MLKGLLFCVRQDRLPALTLSCMFFFIMVSSEIPDGEYLIPGMGSKRPNAKNTNAQLPHQGLVLGNEKS